MSNVLLDTEVTPPERSATRRRTPDRASLAAVVLVAVLVLWVAHFASRSFFFWDDFLYLRQAQLRGLSLGYLVEQFPFNGHLSVSHRLGDWLSQTFFPLDFAFAEGLLLVCFAASVWVLYKVLAELSSRGSGRVGGWPWILTLLYGTSTVPVTMVEWWGTGELRLPPTVLSLAAILAYLRYRRTGSRRSLIWSALALSLALLCYIKPLLVPLYLVLLRLLVLEPDLPVRAWWSTLVRERRVWAFYLVPVGFYLLAFLVWYWEPTGLAAPTALARYLWTSWAASFLPSVAGVYTRAGGLSSTGMAAVVVLQLLFVAVVVASLLRDRRAWRAWAFFAIAYVVNALLVGLPLLKDLGPTIAYRQSYHMEAAYLLPIAVVAAFRPVSNTASTSRAHASLRRFASSRRPVAAVAIAVLLLAHLVVAWRGAGAVVADSPGPATRAYLDNVRTSLDAIPRADRPPTIVDGTVPGTVVSGYLLYGTALPYNRYSQLFRLIDPELRFGTQGEPLYTVAPDGRLHRVPTLGNFAAPAGLAWREAAGTWRSDRGRAYVARSVADGRADLAVLDPGHPPASVRVRMARVAGQAGLVFRYRDPGDYWAVVALPYYGTWAIVRVVQGSQTVVANTGTSAVTDGTEVGVVLQGDTIEVSLSGAVARTVTDPALARASGVGLIAEGAGAGQARFESFELAGG